VALVYDKDVFIRSDFRTASGEVDYQSGKVDDRDRLGIPKFNDPMFG